jgi:hypothetical protein
VNTPLHWSTSRSVIRTAAVERDEQQLERSFTAHSDACHCGEECWLATLENIVVDRVNCALGESRCITRLSLPVR